MSRYRIHNQNEIRFCNAFDLLKEEKELQCIKTNILKLDEELCGGIRMATITDLLGFHLVSHFALQLVMNTILPPPYGLGGQVLWISVYDTPKIQTSMRLLINDYKMHLNLSENDVQLMTESVFFKQVVTPVRFTRTIFQLVQGAKTGRLKNVKLILFDNFARLLRRVRDQLELIRLINEFFQKFESIVINVPCAIVLKNDVVANFDKKRPTIKNKKKKMKKISVIAAWKRKTFWIPNRRKIRSPYKSALGQSYIARISQRLFIRAHKKNKATVRVTRNINNSRGLAPRNPFIVSAEYKPFYGDSYAFCDK